MRRSFYFTKLIASLTLIAFMYSSVLHQALFAAVSLVREQVEINKLTRSEQLIVPYTYGRITSGAYNGNDRLVVYIQDLHCNPEVQTNISKILQLFDTKFGINKIFVEGAPSGKLDTSLISSIPDEQIRTRTIEGLLHKGLLSGSEYYALKFKQDKLYGLEHWATYRQNLDRFRKLTAEKQANQTTNENICAAVETVKSRYLDRKVKTIEKLFNSKTNETRYQKIEWLGAAVDEPVAGYPNLARYIQLIKLSKKIKQRQITEQMSAYVQQLRRTVPMNVYKSLVDTMGTQDNRDEYYHRLSQIAQAYSPNLQRCYPAVSAFFEFQRLNYQINPVYLVEEENLFHDRVMTKYAERLVDKEIILMSRMATYFKDYIDLKMTPNQYKYFIENKETFSLLIRKYFSPSDIQDALTLLNRKDFNDFYAVNFERNAIFLKTISQNKSLCSSRSSVNHNADLDGLFTRAQVNMGEFESIGFNAVANHITQFKNIDIVVAGGFHLDIARELERKGVSYLTITPNVTGTSNQNVYEQVMNGTIDLKMMNSSALAPMLEILGEDPSQLRALLAEQIAANPDVRPEILLAHIHQWQKGKPNLDNLIVAYDRSAHLWTVSLANQAGSLVHHRVFGVRVVGKKVAFLKVGNDGQFIEPLKPTAMQEIETYVTKKTREIVQQRAGSQNQYIGMLKVPFIVLLSVLMVVIASSCSFASHSGQPHTPTPHPPPTQEQTNPGAVDLNPSFSVTNPIIVAQMIDKNSSSDTYWSANNGNQQSVSLQPDPSNPGQKVVQWSWGVKNSIWFGWGINHWAGGAKSIDVQKQGVNNTVLEFTVWGTPGAQFDITFEDNSKTFEDGKQVMISGQPVGHQITVQSSDFITVAKGQRTVLIRMDTLQDMAKKNHIDFDFTQLKDIKFNSTGDIGTTATIYIAGAQLLNVKAYRQQGIGLLIFRGGANVGGKPLVNGVPGDDGNRFPSYSKIDRRIDSGNKPIGTLSYTSIYDNLEQDGVIGEWANLAKHGQIPYDTVEFGQAPGQTDEQYNDLAYNARLHDIVDGKFDNLLKERAQSIARYGGPVLERPLHEFNGTDWYKWSVNNKQDAQLFVEAWQHIVDKYKEYHATNVAFVFSPFALNNPADPNYTLVQYILGQIESSVSVIGIDAYNDTPGINANELLTGLLRAVQRFKKPVMLGETSSSASPAQQEQYWDYLGIDLHNGMYAQYGLIAVTIFDTAKEQNGTWQNFLLPLSVAKQWSVDPFFFSTHLLKLWVNRTHLTSFTMRNGTTVQLRQRYPDNSLMLPDNRARYDHIKNKFGGGLWGEIVAGLYIAIIEVMPLLHTPRKFYKAHGEGEGKGWRFAGVVGVLLSTVIAAAGTFLGLGGIDTIGIAGHMLVPIIAGLSANVIVHAVWNIVWNLKGNPERALTLPPSGGPGSQFFERVGFLSRLSVFWAHLSGSEMPRVAQSALEKKTLSFTEGEIKHTLFRDVIKRMSAHIELPLAKEGGRLIVAFPGNEAAFSVRANAPLHMEEDVTTYMDGVQKGIEFRTISSANQITLDDVLMDHVVVQRHLMYYNFNLRAIKDDLLAKLSGLSKLLQLVLEIGLKNHGISSIEQFQRIIQYGGEVTRWVDQQTGENVISLNKITLDSKNHYQWEIRVPRGMVVNFVEGRLTVQAPAGSTVSFTMRMSTDYPQLTPAPFNTIFNAEALKKMVYDKEFASRMERFSYLFYKEKVVAGSWFYLAGFSRDLEITAVEMWPSLSTQAKKLLLQSLLDLVEKHGSRRGLVLTSDEENNDYFIFRGIEEFRRLIDEGGNDEAAVFGLIDVLRAPEKVSRVYHPLHSEEPHEGDKGPLDGTFLLPPVISLFFDDVKNDIISKREFRSFMTEDNRRTIFENWNTIVELLQPYINSFNELMQSHAINRQAFIADLTATDDIDKTLQAYGILPDQWKALRGSLIVSYINWRDSAQGTGFGRYSEDVNVNLSVVVLEKMKEMVAVLRKMYSRRELKKSVEGMARLDEYISHDTFSDAQEIWKTVEKHYTVKLSVDEIRERMQQYLSNATLTLSEREMLLNLADDDGVTVKEFIGGVGTPKSIAHGILFNAVSLDEQGHPIPLMHTDDIYRAIFLDLPQQEYERILSNYFHRYPYGQKLEFGVLVLNSVLSGSYAKSRQFWNGKAAYGDENRQQLRRWNYHGEVIWNNVMNLLWASIMRQILAATDENGILRSGYSKEYVTKLLGDIEEILRMKKAAGNLIDSELFSWKPGPESTQPQPIAFANDGTLQPGTPLQAWSHHALEMKLDEVLQRLAKNRLFANDPHYQQLYVSRARTAYRYLGLSLGGTKLAIGLIDGNNKLIDDKEIKWNDKLLQDLKKQAWTNGLTDDEIIKDVRAADTMMDFIAGEIGYFLDKNGLTNGEVRAITKISLAGSVDKEKGIFGSDMKTSNLPFDQYPFKEVLMKKLRERAPGVARGVRININNDAEGAGDGEDASIILLGTGVNGWMKDSNHVFGGRGLELGHNIIATSRNAQGHFHFTWVWNTSSGDHPIERGNAASEIIKKSGVMGKKYVSMGDAAFIEEYPSYPVIEWREGFRSASDLFGGQEIWERLGARIKEAGQNKSLSNREGYLKIGAVVGENNANLESALDSEAQNGNDAAIEFIKEIGDEIGRALGAFMAPYSNEKFLNRLVLVSGIGQNFGKRSSRGDVFLAALKRANQEELRTFGISEEQARTLSAGIVRSDKGSEREIIPSQLPSDQEVLDTARHVRPSLLRAFFRLSWLARVKRIQLTRKRINLEANAIKTVLDNIVGGAVLAAPSTVGGADFNDYRYNWIRDAALVMMVLLKKYRQTEDRDLKEQIKLKLEEYRTFNIKAQKNSRGNLAQAKFFPDENPQPYTADTPEHPNPIDEVTGQRQRIWDDQYDGPALRAIAFIDYATMLLEEGKTPEDVKRDLWPLIETDIKFITAHYDTEGSDLWEMTIGYHFFTLMEQRNVLVKASELAKKMGLNTSFVENIRAITSFIKSHNIDNDKHEIISTKTPRKAEQRQISEDSSIIKAVLGNDDNSFIPLDDPMIMKLIKSLEEQFRKEYPINKKMSDGLGSGRYPGDLYDGERFNGANPWYITTLWFAQYYYRVSQRYALQGTFTITSENEDYFHYVAGSEIDRGTYRKGDPLFDLVVNRLFAKGDAILQWVETYYVKNGSLGEQVDKITGETRGNSPLTWSNAEYIQTLIDRENALATIDKIHHIAPWRVVVERKLVMLLPKHIAAKIAGVVVRVVIRPSWFDRQVRVTPSLIGKSIVRIEPSMTPEITSELNTLHRATGSEVVAITYSPTAREGMLVGRISVPYANRSNEVVIMEVLKTINKGIVILTLTPETVIEGRPDELLPAAVQSLLDDFKLRGNVQMLSGVTPWVVEVGADLEKMLSEPWAKDMPWQIIAKPTGRKNGTLTALEVAALTYEGTFIQERSGGGITRKAGLMVRASIKDIRDPSDALVEQGTELSLHGLEQQMIKLGRTSIQLDDLYTTTPEGRIVAAAITPKVLELVKRNAMSTVISFTIPDEVNTREFTKNVVGILRAHPGIGFRLLPSQEPVERMREISSAMIHLGMDPETVGIVDVSTDEQARMIVELRQKTGLTGIIPLGVDGEAEEVTIDLTQSVDDVQAHVREIEKQVNKPNANLVVVRLMGQLPLNGEQGRLNFGDILSVLVRFISHKQPLTKQWSHDQGVRGAQVALTVIKRLHNGSIDTTFWTAIERGLVGIYTGDDTRLLENVIGQLDVQDPQKRVLLNEVENMRLAIEIEQDAQGKTIRSEMLAGLVEELLSEALLRQVWPDITQSQEIKMEKDGSLKRLKKMLVVFVQAQGSDSDSLLVRLMKERMGLVKTTTSQREINDAIALLRDTTDPEGKVVLYSLLAMVPVLNDRDNALKAHLYATELRTYLNLPEQSTTEELKNGVVTFSSKQGGTQLQIAVSLAVYLNILKDDAGQGVLEQGVRSAVPALRAVEQMLAAA